MQRDALLIDDSGTIRALLMVHLSGRDLRFLEAKNGQEGLALLHKHKPPVVVADVNMPVLDGLAFCRLVRADADEHVRDTPIVLLTGLKFEHVREDALLAGATYFLNKPIDPDKLRQYVDACLSTRHRK